MLLTLYHQFVSNLSTIEANWPQRVNDQPDGAQAEAPLDLWLDAPDVPNNEILFSHFLL